MAEGQCSGSCNSLRQLHVIRDLLTFTLYRAWTWWSPKKKIKKSHHSLIGRKMRLYKLSKAIFNMACNRFFLPLSYSNCFSTYYRKSALLKFQKRSRDGQNVFRSRTLPTPALYPVHYSIKPLFQRVNKTQKFK